MEPAEKNKKIKNGFALPKDMLQTFEASRYVQPYSIFYKLNNEFPSKINFVNTDKDKLLQLMLEEFNGIFIHKGPFDNDGEQLSQYNPR